MFVSRFRRGFERPSRNRGDRLGGEPAQVEEEVVTTEDEREGFMIVRAIVRDLVKPARIVMRDQKSYCGILSTRTTENRLPAYGSIAASNTWACSTAKGKIGSRSIRSTRYYEFGDRLRATASGYATA